MKLALMPARATSNRCRHAEERVVRINGSKRADLLHMIRATARHSAGLEDASQWLKIAQPLVTKLFQERARVQVEPGWLDIQHHSQPCRLFDGFAAHEVGM